MNSDADYSTHYLFGVGLVLSQIQFSAVLTQILQIPMIYFK